MAPGKHNKVSSVKILFSAHTQLLPALSMKQYVKACYHHTLGQILKIQDPVVFSNDPEMLRVKTQQDPPDRG